MSSATTPSSWSAPAARSATEQREQIPCLPEDAACSMAPLTLRDGVMLTMRTIRADDTQRLRAFHAHLSLETITLRFFTSRPALPHPMAERRAHMEYENHRVLLATGGTGDNEQILAAMRYEHAGPTAGKVAVVVADDWQGRGIANALLHRLAEYARRRGFVTLVAHTMGWNTRMHSLLRHCGFPSVSYCADGLTVVRLDISQPPEPAHAA